MLMYEYIIRHPSKNARLVFLELWLGRFEDGGASFGGEECKSVLI